MFVLQQNSRQILMKFLNSKIKRLFYMIVHLKMVFWGVVWIKKLNFWTKYYNFYQLLSRKILKKYETDDFSRKFEYFSRYERFIKLNFQQIDLKWRFTEFWLLNCKIYSPNPLKFHKNPNETFPNLKQTFPFELIRNFIT